MSLAIALLVAAAFAVAFRGPIKRAPGLFYALAVLLDVLALGDVLASAAPLVFRALFPYLQQGLLAFGMLSVVMFIGVFPDGSFVKRALRPVRGQLSIIASILIVGHVAHYLQPVFLRALGGNASSAAMMLGVVLSAVLVVLLAVLAVTSINVVRSALRPTTWKAIQRFAYLFYGLVFCHVIAMLAPSALNGAERACLSIGIYIALMIAYVGARTMRARKASSDLAKDNGCAGISAVEEAVLT